MKISIATILLLLTASFEAYNFGLFGGIVVNLPAGKVSFGGMIIGVAISFGAAIASSERGSINKHGKNKRENQMENGLRWLWFLPAVIIAPTIFVLLGDTFNEYLRGVIALAWAMSPSIVMYALGASNGSKGVLKLDTIITLYNPKWFKKETVNEGKPLVKKKLPVKQVSNKPKKLKQVDNKPKQVDKKKKIGKGFTDKQLVNLMEKYPNKSLRFYGEKLGVSGEGVRLRKKKLSNTG